MIEMTSIPRQPHRVVVADVAVGVVVDASVDMTCGAPWGPARPHLVSRFGEPQTLPESDKNSPQATTNFGVMALMPSFPRSVISLAVAENREMRQPTGILEGDVR